MVFPKGPPFARSGSTWIHWWSPVASANRSICSWVTVCQSEKPRWVPTAFCNCSMPWKTFTAYSSRVSGLTVGSTLRTAGDEQDLAGGEPGALADEERHRMGDVLRHPGAGDRDLREERGLELFEI